MDVNQEITIRISQRDEKEFFEFCEEELKGNIPGDKLNVEEGNLID
jgi:hypothetical protein